jgi:hypothetical protein
MQQIDVVRETENGEVIAHFDNGGSIDLRIVTQAPNNSYCLRFNNPYGNLVINHVQLSVLISELNELSQHSGDPSLKNNISKLVSVSLRRIKRAAYLYQVRGGLKIFFHIAYLLAAL